MTTDRDGERDGGVHTLPLKSEDELLASAVVANNAMNRERGLSGVNSYQRELGFDPYAYLLETLTRNGSAAWLDLCCGEGLAVTEAASRLTAAGRRVTRMLRQAGARYDPRRHRLSWHGPITLDFGGPCLGAPRLVVDYLGADDSAGPSYTGQPAVASHYRWVRAIADS